MHAVFRILFIFALRLQHEPLEDVIIPRDDAAHKLAKNKIIIIINVIRQPLNAPYLKSRVMAIVLVTAGARYLKRGVLSISYFREVPSLSAAPSTNDRGRKSYAWCLEKKIRSDLNAKAERRSYLPGLGMNVTLRLRRL